MNGTRKRHFIFKAPARSDRRNSFAVSPACSPLARLTVSFTALPKRSIHDFSSRNNEVLITLLQGALIITIGTARYKLGPRTDVFTQKSHSLFIGKHERIHIEAITRADYIIAQAPRKHETGVRVIRPRDVAVRTVGAGAFRRTVHDIVPEGSSGTVLLAGETFNEPGKWSSFPPHKHDKKRFPKETALEEVYFFKVMPENRFGYIYVYENSRDTHQATVVRNNDIVVIDKGFHPVCVPPGTKLYYFWVLAGTVRKLRWVQDNCFSENT